MPRMGRVEVILSAVVPFHTAAALRGLLHH
jgi:hypothetical protein